jgi:alpha-mannosidase
MFEKEPEYQFVLDGQMLLVDDYFTELERSNKSVSEAKAKITKYVQQRRLWVGPYYVQPDYQLIDGETIIRNIQIGMSKASRFGKPMKIGWLLDNFGQISQAVQLHKEAGMEGLYVWRGVEMDPANVRSEFIWKSPDGSELPSIYLVNSYRNVMRLAEYDSIIKSRIDSEVEKLRCFCTTDNMLLMNGYDQEIVPDDILPMIKSGELDTDGYKVAQTNPEAYLESVLAQKPELDILTGALYSGRFISVFPGVMSSRMYLKLMQDKAEKLLVNQIEPLSSISWLLGYDYPNAALMQTWEILLKNIPHDSICGCSIDDVHSDMEDRYEQVYSIANTMKADVLQYLAKAINTSHQGDKPIVVFNTSSYERDEVVNGRTVHLPALGYATVGEDRVPMESVVITTNNSIENAFLKVVVSDNGEYTLFNKVSGISFSGLGVFEDCGDSGDEYNYSYPTHDASYLSSSSKAIVKVLKDTPAFGELEIRFDMQVPKSTTADRNGRSNAMIIMPIVSVLSLSHASKHLEINTTVKNTARDHIVRVLFPTNLITKTSFGGAPFDVVEHPIHIDDYDESMIPEHVRSVIIGAREAEPNTIFLGRQFVDLNDGKNGLAVLSSGLPEYTVYEGNNTIALTLFRGVDWLANTINTRIGDAGPLIFTPEAECLRQMNFSYAVYPHEGSWEDGGVVREADMFNNKPIVIETDCHEGDLPATHSFFSLSGDTEQVRLTSLVRGKNCSILVRLCNYGTKKTDVRFSSVFAVGSAHRVDYLGNSKGDDMDFTDSYVDISIDAKKIETIEIKLENQHVDCTRSNVICVEQDSTRFSDFSSYPSMPIISDEQLNSEVNRAEQLAPGLTEPLTRRMALEARLSAMLGGIRRNEQEIFALGHELNEARVTRRVYDYIKEFME